MADDDTERPSLEPPKLFGRRKSKKAARVEPVESVEPVTEPEVETAPEPEPEPEPTVVLEPVEPASEPAFSDAGTDDTMVDDVRPARRPKRTTTATLEKAKATPEPPARESEDDTEDNADHGTGAAPVESGPLLTGRPAALATGAVVGLFLVAAVWLGFRGCEAVRGTSSCGTGPGMLALIAIFVVAVVAGRYLLAAFGVPDPGSTSFLAVGLTGVIALLFLVDVLDAWPMLIVIPAITAATYLLSWWVTTTFSDDKAAG